jgi:CubicO group peptidase (beta-lactamase class C family)
LAHLRTHKRKLKVIKRYKTNDAAAGIYSSVNDLSKWAIMQMNNGKYGTETSSCSPKEHDEMWQLQTIIQLKRQLRIIPNGYGLVGFK